MFAGEIFVCDLVLTALDLLVSGNLVLSSEDALIFLQRLFVLSLGFVAARDQILGARCIVGKRPDFNNSACSLERKAIGFSVERRLGDIKLVFSPGLNPFPLST